MKTTAKLLLATLLLCPTFTALAQDEMSNAEASRVYGQKIDIVKSEISTLKKQKKLEPLNADYTRTLQEK